MIAAQNRDEFVVDDLHERLARRKASRDLFAHGPLANAIDEGLYDRQRDIRLEQREPHLPQRVLDIGFGKPPLATQTACGVGQPSCQILKHGAQSTKTRSRRRKS